MFIANLNDESLLNEYESLLCGTFRDGVSWEEIDGMLAVYEAELRRRGLVNLD